MKKIIVAVITMLFIHTFSFAQVTKIPQAAKDNFTEQYPLAENVEWDNDLINVNVDFTLDGEKFNAEYSNKGIWKSTSRELSFDDLPETVKQGFQLSKYSDRQVSNVKVIQYPANITQYRLKVEKNSIQKKYLFFSEKGKLLRDAVTL